MSTPNINPSPEALLAGIEAVAKAIGRNCQMDMMMAMARAEARTSPEAGDEAGLEPSLRDQFAAAALPAVIAAALTGKGATGKNGEPLTEESMAEQAFHFADAMLLARDSAYNLRHLLVSALAEMLDQHENGIAGINRPCADRARAALAAAGAA